MLRCRAGLAAACLLAGACTGRNGKEPTAGGRDSRSADLREYVRLVVALGARDPDSLDYSYAPSDWTAQIASEPPSLDAIRQEALAAADRLDATRRPPDETERWRYLSRQLRAVAVRAGILTGRHQSFDQETQSLFGVTVPRGDAGAPEVYRELAKLLPGAAPLHARYAAFQKRQLVPAARAAEVFARALDGCRERSHEHLRLPPGEQVQISPVRDSPWQAFSRYLGGYRSVIRINLDVGLTVDGALALACHEGYPGHHAQNSIVEKRLVHDRGFREFTVQPLFSPQALVSEGLAVAAVDLAFPGRTREDFERDVLYPLAGLDGSDAGRAVQMARLVDRLWPVSAEIARRYLDGELEFVRASSALQERALVPEPDPLMKFLNEFRTYTVTYTYGPEWVRDRAGFRDALGPEAAWRCYAAAAAEPWSLFPASGVLTGTLPRRPAC